MLILLIMTICDIVLQLSFVFFFPLYESLFCKFLLANYYPHSCADITDCGGGASGVGDGSSGAYALLAISQQEGQTNEDLQLLRGRLTKGAAACGIDRNALSNLLKKTEQNQLLGMFNKHKRHAHTKQS